VDITAWKYLTSLSLAHNGDCRLLGVSGDLTIYAEEVYGDDGWMAQHALRMDGTRLALIDEDDGKNTSVEPIALPDDLVRPNTGWHTMDLNFMGARHRGIRREERISDVAQPLSLEDKALVAGRLNITAPTVLGLAESYVLAEIGLVHPNLFLVCRRLRVLYALQEEHSDAQHQSYDYDSRVLYVAHLFDRSQVVSPTLRESFAPLAGVSLQRPMDCLLAFNHLFVADGGEGERISQVHVWQIEESNEG
jgi:hypothetical protein